jgi:hypothetical protein
MGEVMADHRDHSEQRLPGRERSIGVRPPAEPAHGVYDLGRMLPVVIRQLRLGHRHFHGSSDTHCRCLAPRGTAKQVGANFGAGLADGREKVGRMSAHGLKPDLNGAQSVQSKLPRLPHQGRAGSPLILIP